MRNEANTIQCEGVCSMKDKSESRGVTNKLHLCKGYAEGKHIQLDYSTIVRAQKVGIIDVLLKIVDNFHVGLEQLGIKENNYEEMAKIVLMLQEAVVPIQKRFHTPNVVIGSFESPDTGDLNTIYLTEYAMVLETKDPVNGGEVRGTDPSEIWRYLYPPSRIVENIVSTIIAVAEKHKSIKDDWILSFQRIKDLCLEVRND
jgi:hypothetical protein